MVRDVVHRQALHERVGQIAGVARRGERAGRARGGPAWVVRDLSGSSE